MFFSFQISVFAMAAFDADMQQDPTRMSNIENAITELINEVQYLYTM